MPSNSQSAVRNSPLILLEAPAAVVEHLLAFLEEQEPTTPVPAVTARQHWPRRLLDRLTGWLNKD